MTLFTIPTFTRRPSFALYFTPSSPTAREGPLSEKSLNVATVATVPRRRKVSISAPKSLASSNASAGTRRTNPPSSPKRSRAQRVTRTQSRQHFLVPKASPTQTLTLTSAISTSSLAQDIEDVDINTISFPSPPSPPRPVRSKRSHSQPVVRPTSPTPPSGTGPRSLPLHPGMGRGRGLVTQPARAGPTANPRIRTSTSPPNPDNSPIQKRARLHSISSDHTEDAIPERPGSPTPGSDPASSILPSTSSVSELVPVVSPSLHLNQEDDDLGTTFLIASSNDDDDDIIVFKMDVEEPLSRPPSPAELQQLMEGVVEVASDMSVALDVPSESSIHEDADVRDFDQPVSYDLVSSSSWSSEEDIAPDAREDMQRQSMILAKRVRKRMNPSLPDDSPPPTPSPVRLRQAIATMFLEQSNSFPPMRRRSPEPERQRRSTLSVEVYSSSSTTMGDGEVRV